MNIAPFIDHTLLRPDTTSAEIQVLCQEAVAAGFAAVCVPPVFIREAKHHLGDTTVALATVIGFPFGYHLTAVKSAEAELAILSGADELDMVINLAALKSGDWRTLETEIRELLEIVKLSSRRLKVIIESGMLTAGELEQCCEFYGRFNIDFIKTSTGYTGTGATVEAVRTLRSLLPAHIAIKASGGIRSYAFAKELIDAGAARIGSSASMQILKEAQSAS
jgi:deoxyribose-phosphate aldolase